MRTGEGNIRPDRGRIIPAEPWEGVWNPIQGFMDVPVEERDYVLPNAKNFPGLLTKEDVFAEATPKVRPESFELPSVEALQEALPKAIAKCAAEGCFADPAVTEVTYTAKKKSKK